MNTRSSLIGWALAILSALLFVAHSAWHRAPMALEMEIRTATCARVQVFYDTGQGTRQQDSTTKFLAGRNGFQRVTFDIDAPTVRGLTLDLFRGPGKIDIRNAVVRSGDRELAAITSGQFIPVQDVKLNISTNGVTTIEAAENATAPVVAVHFDTPVRAQPHRDWRGIVLTVCLGLAAIMLVWFDLVSQSSSQPAGVSYPRCRWTVIGVLTAVYLAASLSKLNGSSTALWRYYGDRESPRTGIVFGSAKEIRSDEWLTETPWILSQARHDPPFPLANPALGDGLAPLLNNLPVRHWSMIFRPQMWPFFFADIEHAFALNWNFKWFSLVLGAFLFFEILTARKLLLSIGGALLLLFSSYMQWWFSSQRDLPEMLAMFYFAMWALTIIERSNRRGEIVGASVVLLFAIMQFVLCAYPRFQIPLMWLSIFMISAAIVRRSVRDQWPKTLQTFRITFLAATLLIAGVLTALWFRELLPTIKLIEGLYYPGRTFFTGGHYPWINFFAPFLELKMTEQFYPVPFANVCEAAGFIFVAPLLIVAVINDAWRRRLDWTLLGIVLFVIFMTWFMTIGIPAWLAKSTGWSYVPTERALFGFGVASIVGLVRYLSGARSTRLRIASAWQATTSWSNRAMLAGVAMLFALFLIVFHIVNVQLDHFAATTELIATSIFFGLTFWLIWRRSLVLVLILLLLPLIYVAGSVNPVSRGLRGITRGRFVHWVESVRKTAPNARWLVIGNSSRSEALPHLVKATGVNAIGGTYCTPDAGILHLLDPGNEFAQVHDRYARVRIIPGNDPKPQFKLTALDAYEIRIPLDADLMRAMEVNYVLEVDGVAGAIVPAGFKAIGRIEDCRLLEVVALGTAQ